MIHIWHEDSSGSATNLFWEFLNIEGSYYGGGQSGVSWSGDTTGEWPANTGTNPDKFGYRFL